MCSLDSRYPAFTASASFMYLPCLVFPYHLSPSRWNTFVSVLTQTMPLTGGGPADSDIPALEEEDFEAMDGLLEEAAAGWEAAAGAAFAATVTSGLIFSIVFAETPAFDRSATEE